MAGRPSVFSRSRDRLLELGERYTSGLPLFVLVSAVLTVPLTALVRVVQMLTVTNAHLWLGILGVLPGAVLAVASLVAVMWAFGTAKQAAERAYGVGLLASVLAPVMAVESTAGIVTVLWRHGAFAGKPGSVPGLWTSERYFLWHTLDALPFLKIDETFGWGEPSELASSTTGWIVVGLKVLVLIPLARVLVSAYWWVRARESDAEGDGTDVAGFFVGMLTTLTVFGYAFVIWLWPPNAALARLIDRLPKSADLFGHHIALGWVTPTVRWLVLAVLLFLCILWGLASITMAFFRHDSLGMSLLAVFALLLWMHVALILTAATTMLFVRTGVAVTTPALPADASLTVGVGDQLWGLANAIPGLDIPETTHWARQYVFSGWPVGALSLGFRLSALFAALGLLWLLGRVVRLVHTGEKPDPVT